MDAICGIWSAQVPAIITDHHSLRAKGQVVLIYDTSEPLHIEVLLGRTRGLPAHIWQLSYNLFYGPFEEFTFHARKDRLSITLLNESIHLFLDSLEIMRQIGADSVPSAWDELLDRLRETS